MHQNLEDAICLLALISDRSPGLEESTQEMEPSDIDRELESYPNDDEFDDLEDPTVLGADPKHEQYYIELKNQFLDRLAGTLARFKTDAQAKTPNDAKHVSAAMMVCYEDEERVKIFCAKNEGLEQDDEDFLAKWKLLMESIARKGSLKTSHTNTSDVASAVVGYVIYSSMSTSILRCEEHMRHSYIDRTPMHFPRGKGGSSTQLNLAMDRLLTQLKVSLESLLNSARKKHRNLRAQSSHALSGLYGSGTLNTTIRLIETSSMSIGRKLHIKNDLLMLL